MVLNWKCLDLVHWGGMLNKELVQQILGDSVTWVQTQQSKDQPA